LLWLLKLLLLSNIWLAAEAAAEGLDTTDVSTLRGKIVAVVRCAPCHHLQSNHVKVGPGLLGIFGRSPTISGVPFDVWDTNALQQWLRNPRQVKANTRMVLPYLSDRDRNDIIAWLQSSQPLPKE